MEFRDFMHHRFFKGVVKDFFVLYFADLGILKNWGGRNSKTAEDSSGRRNRDQRCVAGDKNEKWDNKSAVLQSLLLNSFTMLSRV